MQGCHVVGEPRGGGGGREGGSTHCSKPEIWSHQNGQGSEAFAGYGERKIFSRKIFDN
jgi:hypothetical protein